MLPNYFKARSVRRPVAVHHLQKSEVLHLHINVDGKCAMEVQCVPLQAFACEVQCASLWRAMCVRVATLRRAALSLEK